MNHGFRWGPSCLPAKAAQQLPPLFGPRLLWPNGRPSQQMLSSCCQITLTTCFTCWVQCKSKSNKRLTVQSYPLTRYNRLSKRWNNQFDNRLNVCLNDAAGCSTGCSNGLTTGWTTGYIVHTNIQPVVKPVVQPAVCAVWRLRLNDRLHRVNRHSTGCSTGLTTGCSTGLTTGWMSVVSCKWAFRLGRVRHMSVALFPFLLRINYSCLCFGRSHPLEQELIRRWDSERELVRSAHGS